MLIKIKINDNNCVPAAWLVDMADMNHCSLASDNWAWFLRKNHKSLDTGILQMLQMDMADTHCCRQSIENLVDTEGNQNLKRFRYQVQA